MHEDYYKGDFGAKFPNQDELIYRILYILISKARIAKANIKTYPLKNDPQASLYTKPMLLYLHTFIIHINHFHTPITLDAKPNKI